MILPYIGIYGDIQIQNFHECDLHFVALFHGHGPFALITIEGCFGSTDQLKRIQKECM